MALLLPFMNNFRSAFTILVAVFIFVLLIIFGLIFMIIVAIKAVSQLLYLSRLLMFHGNLKQPALLLLKHVLPVLKIKTMRKITYKKKIYNGIGIHSTYLNTVFIKNLKILTKGQNIDLLLHIMLS
jgi:hypothetical protein